MVKNVSSTRHRAAWVTALFILVVLVQLVFLLRYDRHVRKAVDWRTGLQYVVNWRGSLQQIIADDRLFFQSLQLVPYRRADRQALAPVESPAPATFIADIGIGWERLSKGRWTWRGSVVGSYPPPAEPTAADGTWSPRSKGWKTNPRDSRKWNFEGSFNGPIPPSPPGPQTGSYRGFAGVWTIDKESSSGKIWTWHGSWTGQLPLP